MRMCSLLVGLPEVNVRGVHDSSDSIWGGVANVGPEPGSGTGPWWSWLFCRASGT